MKNQLLGVLAIMLIALVSCTETTTSTAENADTAATADAPDYAAFDKKVEILRTFYKTHGEEDLAALDAMVAEDMQWSPTSWNDNQHWGKAEFMANLKGYHDGYDNIKFIEGNVAPDSTYGGYWSGSVFPAGDATTDSDLIRVYGTWTCTHVESGQEMGIKFYALAGLNEEGKVNYHSDYFDIASLMPKEVAEE